MRSFLAALLLCSVGAVCQAQDVVVRSHVEPRAGAVVGQHVRIMIDVLFRAAMPRPPRVTIGEAPGAQVLRTETQATTMSDRIDGQPYVGQRFEFALYARRGGMVVVPPATVTLLDAKGDEVGALQGKPLQVEVSVPAGVDPSAPVVATVKATLDEQWSPAPTTPLKTGDAVVRTITRTAADVPAMAMLDLAFAVPAGVRIYVDPPQGEDSVDRGDLTGRRVDRVTYVFESAGIFEIPAVVQPWWDLRGSRLQEAKGAGAKITIAALTQASDSHRRVAIAVGLAVVLLGMGWWLAPRARTIWTDRQQRRQQSEAKAFRDFDRACRQGDAQAIYRAFVIWRQRTAQPWMLASLAEELEQALYGSDRHQTWSGVETRGFRKKARDARRTIGRAHAAAGHGGLPPLNPSRCDTGGLDEHRLAAR